MKASISFPELQNLLADSTKQTISLAYIDEKTIHVSTCVALGFLKKNVDLNLRILDVAGSDVLLCHSGGMGMETIVGMALNFFKDKIPAGLIENRGDGHLMFHLDVIDELKAVFDKIDVRDLNVLADGVEVEGMLK